MNMIMLKLNLGCGHRKFISYVNIDIKKECNPDICLDIEKEKLPFKDSSVMIIYSNHFLEHITPQNWIKVLKEMYRVSKNGAIWIIKVPYGVYGLYNPFHYRAFNFLTFDYFNPKHDTKQTNIKLIQLNKASLIKRLIYRIIPKKEITYKLKCLK